VGFNPRLHKIGTKTKTEDVPVAPKQDPDARNDKKTPPKPNRRKQEKPKG